MSRSITAITLALLLLLVLVATAPARLMALVLPAEQVVLQGLSGSLWQGRAARCLLQLPGGYLHLGGVQWSLSPLSLLTLAPRLTVQSQWGAQGIAGEVTLRGDKDLYLEDVDAALPAELLRQFLPVELAGTLSLQAQSLRIEGGLPTAAQGRLVWQGAGWRAGQALRPLGSYVLEVQQPPGQPLSGQVLTLAGDVQAGGSVRLTGRDYLIDVVLAGPGLADPQLQQALQLVATPREDDYHLLLRGEI